MNQIKKRILIVEDELIVGVDLKRILQKMNYEVINIVKTAEQAILQASKQKPDLILMDIQLVGSTSGIQAAEEIKKSNNIPIIFLTAFSDDRTFNSAKTTDPFGYIIKPYNENILYVSIEMALYKYNLETQLKESEERYRSLVENSPVGVAIYTEGVVVYCNPVFKKIINIPENDEIIGKEILSFIHPAYKKEAQERYESLNKKVLLESVYRKMLRKRGEWVDVETVETPIIYNGKKSIQSITKDISELKKRERFLQASLKVLQSATFASSFDDLYTMIFDAVNDFIHVRNLSIAFIEGREKIIYPFIKDEQEQPKSSLYSNSLEELVVNKNKTVLLNSSQIKNINSSSAYKSWLGVPLFINENKIGVLSLKDYQYENYFGEEELNFLQLISFPISRAIEKKILEEERTRHTRDLEELNKTKDKFFSVLAHDLRSPFNSIFGFIEILKEDWEDLPEKDKNYYLDALEDNSRNVFNQLNNLLVYSRFQMGMLDFNPKQISISTLLDRNLKMIAGNAIKKEIKIENKIENDFCVYAEEDMLNSVIQNLITNAIKFTQPGGYIRISSDIKGSMAEIKIEDNGIGIDEEKLTKLFKVDVKKSTPGTQDEKGTGLGLLLTKEFVERNGGSITVSSSPGKGSTFCFSIPVIKT